MSAILAMARLLFLTLLLVAGAARAGEAPRWSVEFKGGPFSPRTEQWTTYYPDAPGYFEVGAAYKPFRQVELALSAGYLSARGEGLAPLHGVPAGRVDYELVPIHAALLWRGVFSEGQWLVPYVGGGWTRMGYRQQVEFQSDVTGSADGYHSRAGLQLLLDRIDPRAASFLKESNGVEHTYFFIEYQRTDVTKTGVQLGGSATLAGFLLEF